MFDVKEPWSDDNGNHLEYLKKPAIRSSFGSPSGRSAPSIAADAERAHVFFRGAFRVDDLPAGTLRPEVLCAAAFFGLGASAVTVSADLVLGAAFLGVALAFGVFAGAVEGLATCLTSVASVRGFAGTSIAGERRRRGRISNTGSIAFNSSTERWHMIVWPGANV